MSNTFKGLDLYVGLDVHKKSWHVSIVSAHKTLKSFTHPPCAIKLSKHLNKNYPEANYHLAYEAGFSGFGSAKTLNKLGMNCIVVNAADVPTTDKEKRQKSDQADSKKIALSLRAGQLKAIYIPSDDILIKRSLVRYREKLVRGQTRCKNRIRHYLYNYNIPVPEDVPSKSFSKLFIVWLNEMGVEHVTLLFLLEQLKQYKYSIKMVTIKMKEQLLESYKVPIELLKSIPGISFISAATIYTEIADISRFSNLDKLSSYVGLIPTTRSSGEYEKIGYMTKRSNTKIKNVLIEASWIAVSKDPELLACYEKLCLRMSGSRAIIRIARKLLSRIKAILMTGQPYQINYNLSA